MIEMMLDKYILYVLMGCVAAAGIVSKVIVSIVLKRLVRAAGSMGKSTHPFMRLVRAKFEHTCMISDKVENVGVFVDKFLYEYKTAGVKLHTIRRMETASAVLCLILGAVGAFLAYMTYGMQEEVFRLGGVGVGLAVLVYAVHLLTDEKYRLEAVKNYMIDYLENICLKRYEKNYRREIHAAAPEVPIPDFGEADEIRESEFVETESMGTESMGMESMGMESMEIEDAEMEDMKIKAAEMEIAEMEIAEKETVKKKTAKKEAAKKEAVRKEGVEEKAPERRQQEPIRPHPGREVPSPRTSPEIEPPTMPEPYEVPDVTAPVRAAKSGRAEKKALKEKMQETAKDEKKDVLIRQILEEFMA